MGEGAAIKDHRASQIVRVSVLLLALACLLLLSLTVGRYAIAPKDCARALLAKVFNQQSGLPAVTENVIWNLRWPRAIAAMLVGAALSLSGAVYQGVFANPLVSPDLLGVSSGACVGAALSILLSIPSYVQPFAFAIGMAAVLITFLLARLFGNRANTTLVLSGIIVSGLFSSLLGLLKYLADPLTQLADITYWQLGSFAYVRMQDMVGIWPIMMIASALLIGLGWWIDILSIGEMEARAVGALRCIRGLSLFLATVLTACAVCISGTIGWVGLVTPHLSRTLAGPCHRRMLPIAMIIGAALMVLVDILARTLTPLELPISIVTGALYAPLYGFILYKRRALL